MLLNPEVIDLKAFKRAFIKLQGWKEHFGIDTPLYKFLGQPYFYPDVAQKPNEISFIRLSLVGILLCNGTAIERAEVLFSVIQEPDHDFISSADKDFFPAF